MAEAILSVGDHHLLLVPAPQAIPSQALICVATGEPGKDDVLFAGRLVRHLGAETTLMTILPQNAEPALRQSSERFLSGGIQSLSLLGVPARASIRSGLVQEEIEQEMRDGGYDLLVLGAPLSGPNQSVSISGVVEEILNRLADKTVLIVRSRFLDIPRPGSSDMRYERVIP